ncbi:AbrB/MazE/SpoVT family DNA-binding domain-containing protein [Candidatus Woesearchaeota archaeon]|nr:AbrB/MazE/SpoVT family DNA-binding domain-containing protein [Candidatus Woesearchaeota archaeon]
MRRKLVKQAGQAVTITLPIEWVRSNGLKPGDEIDVEAHEKDLVLNSGKKIIGSSIKVKTTASPRRMRFMYINAAYAKGIDEIELELDKEAYPELDQEIGYAVVSQKDKKYIIRDVSGVSSEDLDEIFKRVFQMIIKFYDSAVEDIFGENKESYETVRKMDHEINKFALFLQRSIMKQSYPDPGIGKILFAYSFALEKIGDEILRLWRTNIENKVKKDNKVKELVLLSKEGLAKAFAIYYQTSDEKIKEAVKIRKEVRNKSLKLFDINPATAKFIMHAIKITEDSYDLTHLSLMKKLK